MTPDDRVAAVFANQFGVIGFHQAEQAGMGRDQIEYQWRIGRWRRPVRGVYCSPARRIPRSSGR